jgi:hypothetical protein
MIIQQLQKQSLVIQEGGFEGKRRSRFLEGHDLIRVSSYSSSFVHASLLRVTRAIRPSY